MAFRCVGRLLALGVVRGAKGVWRGLVAFGEAMVGGLPGGGEQDMLTGPLPGHPERLLTDVPLSALERELVRELTKLSYWPPTRSLW
ncbi:DUF6059 family protein [Streptomyces sp. NPDC048416]|uniref:DUF6059 family protein n=1 Tax=Streptomyces sp. NPDC048416 TaxID=3365546 RepID=UPI003717F4BA